MVLDECWFEDVSRHSDQVSSVTMQPPSPLDLQRDIITKSLSLEQATEIATDKDSQSDSFMTSAGHKKSIVSSSSSDTASAKSSRSIPVFDLESHSKVKEKEVTKPQSKSNKKKPHRLLLVRKSCSTQSSVVVNPSAASFTLTVRFDSK